MIIEADALQGLLTIETATADTCITSPPYYGLRDYGIDGQIGLEATPGEYIERLVTVFREVRRTLRDDGTLWVIIGDSYAGNGYRGGGAPNIEQRNLAGAKYPPKTIPNGCKAKDLMGIPWLLAFALRTDGWFLRQDIIWQKPNAMPESVTDRCTKSHEYIFLFSKSERYYFNAKAIRETAVSFDNRPVAGSGGTLGAPHTRMRERSGNLDRKQRPDSDILQKGNQAGHIPWEIKRCRNKRSVWTVATKSNRFGHSAVFPPDLIRPCVRAGSRPGGTILDPFFGTGTTGLVAAEEERQYIGIEISPEYYAAAKDRLKQTSRRVSKKRNEKTITQLRLEDFHVK